MSTTGVVLESNKIAYVRLMEVKKQVGKFSDN